MRIDRQYDGHAARHVPANVIVRACIVAAAGVAVIAALGWFSGAFDQASSASKHAPERKEYKHFPDAVLANCSIPQEGIIRPLPSDRLQVLPALLSKAILLLSLCSSFAGACNFPP